MRAMHNDPRLRSRRHQEPSGKVLRTPSLAFRAQVAGFDQFPKLAKRRLPSDLEEPAEVCILR